MLCLACASSAEEHGTGSGREASLFVPEGLSVAAKPGGCGELRVTALTLRRGPTRAELYAALANEGDTPACSPAFSIELSDGAGQPLATGLGGVLVRSFYRLNDAAGSIAACVAPGDTGMVAIDDLPAELHVEDVRELVYFCNFWELEGAPLAGLAITDVRALTRDGSAAYAGSLVNGFEVPLPQPEVAVFTLTGDGRPLEVARAERSAELAAFGTWQFETSNVSEPSEGYAAYPAHGP